MVPKDIIGSSIAVARCEVDALRQLNERAVVIVLNHRFSKLLKLRPNISEITTAVEEYSVIKRTV